MRFRVFCPNAYHITHFVYLYSLFPCQWNEMNVKSWFSFVYEAIRFRRLHVCVGVCNTTCKRKNDALECCVATMTCQLSVAQLSMRQLCAISVTRTHRATNISNNKYAISFFVHGKLIFLHLHLTWERLRCEQWPNKWTTQRIPFCPFGDYCIPTIHICKSLTLHINFGQDNAMYTLSAMWNMEIEYFVAFPFVHTFSRKHARRM